MTMLYFHNSMFTHMYIYIYIYMYMTFGFFYISGSFVVLPVDHLNMNKTIPHCTFTRYSFSYRTPKHKVNL